MNYLNQFVQYSLLTGAAFMLLPIFSILIVKLVKRDINATLNRKYALVCIITGFVILSIGITAGLLKQ